MANFEFSRSLLLFLLHKSGRPRYWLRPKAALFVPLEVTQIEYKVYTELLESVGARSGVLIVESTFQTAGHSLPPSYKMIVEISPEDQ